MSGYRILIVDDEPDLREVFKEVLESESFQVTQAASGNEAIQLFRDHDFDSIISDIRMPDGSGLDFLQYIRNTSERDIHFFLMTGFGDVTPEEAYDYGASSLFKKPINLKTVLYSIKKVCDLSQEAYEVRPPRYQIRAPITIDFETLNISLKTEFLNLSRGGLLLKKMTPKIEVGFEGNFRIYHGREGAENICGRLQLIRRAGDKEAVEAGFGAKFLSLEEKDRKRLEKLLIRLEEKVIPVK